MGYNGEAPTYTLGYGDDPAGARRKAETDAVGPCITSVLDLRDASKPVEQGMIIEDIGLAGALCEPCNPLFAAFSDVARQSFAEHLIATKALRCTATAWIPHCR